MSTTSPPTLATASGGGDTPIATSPDQQPAGERYLRHPGDVVRLVLWGTAVLVLALLVTLATTTTDGVTADLGRAAGRLSASVREFVLALVQVAALAAPAGVVGALVFQRRWRRLLLVLVAGAGGALCFTLLDVVLDLPVRLAGSVDSETWVASSRFPSLAYLAGAVAATTVGLPWLARSWRRAAIIALLALGGAMAVAATAGVAALMLAGSVGAAAGAALLIAFGTPNRRPSPAAVLGTLRDAGVDVTHLRLDRAEGGRAQLYDAATTRGNEVFVKVYARDSRDADILYRCYRTLLLRGADDEWSSPSLAQDVEHEAFLLLLAARAGVACPEVEALSVLPDGSVALALQHVPGCRLDEIPPTQIDADLLDAVWRQVTMMHRARLAHGSLRAANILVTAGQPVIIDFGSAQQSAPARLVATDRAELLASLAALVGCGPAVASAARVLDPAQLAAALPYLQPLALSASTRRQVPKATLRNLRETIATTTGVDPVPLERLVRVRPRTLLTITALAGAFYILLPQLADVDDSLDALGSANWGWLAACLVMSGMTYICSAVGLAGGIRRHLPFIPTVGTQLASSFVNRITPANVGGMALNVRFMQKVGIEPAEAVTGVGLNVATGGLVHVVLLVVFLIWAGRSGAQAFRIPANSKMLVAIAIVLAAAGLVAATRWGRRLIRTHVTRFLKQSLSGLSSLARSPLKIALLLGGSVGVTLAYVAALATTLAAFQADISFAQVGAVYLGSSIVAAAAPTPGGLGAMEAALVAGLTGVGLDSGVAVASVLTYRLATYWLPILPGWISFHLLERRGWI